ncbi:hypothetical protein BH10BAC6_BH10BAC6_06430 [soil metagenome]
MRLFLLLLLATTCLRAQTPLSVEAIPGITFFTPLSTFTSISGVPNPGGLTFAPQGMTLSGHFMIGADFSIANQWRLGLRTGFQGGGATYTATEKVTIAQPSGPYIATIEHTMTVSFLMLNTEPYLRYEPLNWLAIDVGFPFMIPLIPRYKQTQVFTDPAGLQFTDGSVEQETGSGTLSSIRSPVLFGSVRASALLPLTSRRDVFLTPQVDVQTSLQSLVTTATVAALLVRVGVGVRYSPQSVPTLVRDTTFTRDTITVLSSRAKQAITELADQQVEEFGSGADTVRVLTSQHYRTTLPKPAAVLRAALRVAFVGYGGKDVTDASVQIRKVLVTRHVPLLPVVVFTQLESALPSRYVKLPRREAQRFSESSLKTNAATHWQYHVLNVIGSRMMQHAQTRLTIHGVDDGSEAGGELIRGRIESVRTYIMSSFGIAPSRLSSDVEHAERYHDWISMSDSASTLTAPLHLSDTILETTLPVVRIYPDAVNEAPLRAWSVMLSKDSSTIRSFADTLALPTQLSWNMNEDLDADSAQNSTIVATLSLFDVEGNVASSEPSTIRVRAPQDLNPNAAPFERVEYLVISAPNATIDELPKMPIPTSVRSIDVWNGSPSVAVPGVLVRAHGMNETPWFRKNLADPELYFWSSETRLYTKE